jgi:hypothetical protein
VVTEERRPPRAGRAADDLLFGGRRAVDLCDQLAVAQDEDPVADSE